MAYRYTNTDKWVDVWFRKLKPVEKLLFIYLCDNCDIAGFIEYDIDKWAFDIGYNRPQIEGALKGLARGLIFSTNNDCIYICNFLKHQKNLPLNESNKAHIGILKRFELYSYKFNFVYDYEGVNKFIEGATKGLPSPTGNGNGNGNGNGKDIWQNNFEIYKQELRDNLKDIFADSKWMQQQEKYNPGVDIKMSIEKSVLNYWGKEAGWKKKKSARIDKPDWKATFANAVTMKSNIVYK